VPHPFKQRVPITTVGEPLNIYYQNVRGLNTKTVNCLSAIHAQDNDIIVFTETWLSESVQDAELVDDRYVVFRRDRNGRGGGVMIAVKVNKFRAVRRLDHLHTVGEHLWICLETRRSSLFICVLYFPPGQKREITDAFFEKIQAEQGSILNKHILILGDFNLSSSDCARDLDLISNLFDLNEINRVYNYRGGRLDLIFTNINNYDVTRSDYLIVPEDNYHPALSIKTKLTCNDIDYPLNCDTPDYNMRGWNFNNVDFELLNNTILSTCNWRRVYECDNVDLALTTFYAEIYHVFDQCFPRKGVRKNNRIYPKWFSRDVISILKRKHAFHKVWKASRNPLARVEFRALRILAKKMLISCHRDYYNQCESTIIHDPGKFWRFISSKRCAQSAPTVLHHDTATFEGHKEIADAFAGYFYSVYDDSSSIPENTGNKPNPQSSWASVLSINEIDILDMRYGFRKLKSRNSAGPDFIPDFVLKGCQVNFLAPLKFIFNLSLKKTSFPDLWRCTKVTPIHKKGDLSCIENYRPIAIPSAPAKLFDIILHRYIHDHCRQALVDQQHGFRPKRSTITNLLCLSRTVTRSLDAKIQVDVVYTDFQKAFDKVSHKILLRKLNDFGFSNGLVSFFSSYLTNRRQYVTYGECRSDEYFATSGVPQGSNLGPLLFLLFINDIHLAIKSSQFLLYADDLKVFQAIRTIADSQSLQHDLELLWKWSNDNHLPFSINKCHVVTFSRSPSPIEFLYGLGGTVLSKKASVEDLGVIFENKWRFKKHITNVCDRSMRMLGFVMRNARNLNNLLAIRALYNMLIRSILEYGSIVWNPYDRKYSLLLERVQGKFLRYLYKREYGTYPFLYPTAFLLGALGYNSLHSRRRVYAMKHFLKLLRGGVDSPSMLSELQLRAVESSRECRTRDIFTTISARTSALENSPINRAIQHLNWLARHRDVFSDSYEMLEQFMWDSTNIL
jgi:hypothetical protein